MCPDYKESVEKLFKDLEKLKNSDRYILEIELSNGDVDRYECFLESCKEDKEEIIRSWADDRLFSTAYGITQEDKNMKIKKTRLYKNDVEIPYE